MLFGYGLLLGPVSWIFVGWILEMFCSCSYVIFTLSHVLVISWKWCTGSRFSIMKMECSRLTPNQENPGYRESWYPTTMGKKSTWGLYVITDSGVSEAHAASKNPTVVIEASMSSPFLHHQAGLCLRHMYLTRKITSDLSSQEAKLRKNSSSYGTKSSHMSFSE